jgi:hypothetical protein
MTLCLGPTNLYEKASLSSMTITSIVTSTTTNKSFILNTGLTNAELADIVNGYFVIYTEDNEFLLGSYGVGTKNEVWGATHGVVAMYSTFYDQFYDGDINTGDYFYGNKIPTARRPISSEYPNHTANVHNTLCHCLHGIQ